MNGESLHRRNFLLHLQERADYDHPVLLKEPAHEQPTRFHLDQLHNEFTITSQLADVPGVRPAYAIEGTESQPVLLLEYIQGQSLVELIRSTSLDLAEKLRLAVNMATVLHRIHDQQVMHKDISSGNILVADNHKPGSQDGVYIIDFGIASTMRQESVSHLAPDDVLGGTLAYISPEQTGRMNRQVDYRTDLYSLGVILYELFTGQLPFESGDALEMIHAHIARQPRPPQQIDAGIPGPVSDIILKSLAKNAEDRYQTAHGLQTDLERCLEQWQDNKRIEPFALGGDDFTGRLQIPQKLYGRQAEIEQLAAAYDRMVQGNTELMYITGYSGVGKTALVHEVRRDILVKGGVFIEGKFDQLQRTLPYSVWAQAFTRLANNWLTESETKLAGWRETILEAVGDQGQILIDIIPALEHIIGPQPEVPQLGGVESQNRFNYIFNRFINGLATPEHPLVVFLDDLQWIDPASLNLIQSLLTVQSTSSFLIIGAYRNNEVDPDHPLTASQERMRDEGKQVTIITLQDLTPADTNHMLADTLQLTVADCGELSQALVDKTAGNPFFFRQQLYALESEALLSFDRQRRRWVWAEDLQQSLQAGGNVVDLMTSKIQTLPVETQHILSMAACLGSRFETSTLDTITGRSQMDILSNLNPALQDGLIVRSNGYFNFVHDRVREAGYSLIPQADLPKTHLEIGRLLLADVTDEALNEEIFAIVGHLNVGRALIDTDSEKVELARLSLKAGQKAKAAAAFADAKQYIEIGLELLGPDSWQEHYDLTLSLHNENGELASLTGRFEQIAPIVDLIRTNAKSVYDQMDIYMTQIEAETSQYNFAEALDIGLDLLRTLGVEIPAQPTGEDIQRFNNNLLGLLTTEPIEKVAKLEEMTDERALAACSLFAAVMSTAYIVNPPLLPVMAILGATFTMEYGLNAWAPLSFGNIPMLAFASINPETPADEASKLIQFNKQLVEATRQMIDNPVTAPSRTKGLMMLAFVTPWIEPIEQGIELAQTTFQNGFESGDLLYASYGAYHFAMQGFAAGMNLELYQSQLSEQTDSLIRVGQKTTPQYLSIYLQTAQNFQKVSSEPDKLNGTYLSEDEWLPAAQAANDLSGLHNFSINKLILMYHFDLDEALAGYAGEVEDFLVGGPGFFSVPLIYLYLALAKLRLVDGNSSKERPETMTLVNKSLHWMEIWSKTMPSTFQHKFDLMAAEKARVLGEMELALSHYEQAMRGARESGFTQEEALANELYARFWAERGNERFASQFMREAHSLYRKWGALAKAEHLAKRYPNWLIGRGIVVDQPGTKTTSSGLTADLDLLTVLKASQDIAGEIALDGLLAKLMTNVIENSGAQQGYLILEQDELWKIAAEAGVDDTKTYVGTAKNIAETDLLAQEIVHYVARTQETMVLEDAFQSGEFVQDPYVQNHQARSILCTPLINQGKTSGILYLENNLAPRVFSAQRVNLLQLLSAQMAISIDNARIHDNLEALVAERTQELEAANQAKSIFLANMSHELRTPLNAILGFAQLLARDEDLSAQQQERLSIINRSGEYLLDMVGDILTLSRIESGRVGLSEEIFDFRQTQEDIERIFRSQAEGKGLGFSLELADDLPPYLRGDAGKLRQVLINLLDNAVKYTQAGTVHLRASAQATEAASDRVMLQFEVEDSGAGIPPEKLDEIFETFVQVEQANRTQEGVGLGLSISKSLVDMMGGEIRVTSEEGQGTHFKLNIPMLIADEVIVKADEPLLPEVIGLQPGQKDWRILVVDDNRENLLLLTDLLAQAGFSLQETKNGAEAVAKFEEWRPHFIWMDVRMPGMDGYEATKRIRVLPGGDTVKIVVITASVIEDPQQVIQDTGVDDVVLKPFRDQEIFAAMARELGVEYVYRDRPAAPAQSTEIELSAEMLAELPPDLLQELNQTTLVADREATLEVIERIEAHAPETATSLRALVENFQMGRLRDLLKETETKNDN